MMRAARHPSTRGAPWSRRALPRAAGARAALVAGWLLGLAGCMSAPRSADTVVFASGADLESANPLVTVHPLSRQVQRFVLFVTLVRYDSTLAPAPYLAREWTWSADRRRLTFVLARSLRWHDGRPTTARDAAFTIDAARDPATGYPRYADLAELSAVRAEGDSVLALEFSRPQPRFPLVLCELPLVPEHLLRDTPRAAMKQATFGRAPTGNGPFRFVRRDVGQRWVFERNDAFPAELGGPPRVRRLVVAVVDEAATKFAGLVSGELDFAGISPTAARLAARDQQLRVVDYPVLFTTGIVFNTHAPPFDDPRVRTAVAAALDRRRIVDAALAGFGVPASGPVPPDHPFALGRPATPDTARADSLLDAAGWRRGAGGLRARGGRPLAFQLLTVATDNAIEQLIQADLAARGVRVEIRQREMGAFLADARAARKTFDALITGIPGDVSLAYLTSMYDSRLAGGALDYGAFHTPRLDSLLAAARSAPTDSLARAGWLAVQLELEREAPVAWVYHSRGVQGVSRRMRGVRMDLRGEMPTVAQWWSEGRRGANAPAVAARP